MKRLESNLLNMVLSLTIVAVAAAALLGGLYVLTAEPIAQQKIQKQQAALTEVLPNMEGMTIAEGETVEGQTVYKALVGDEMVGAAVETAGIGFGGTFKVMVGFDKEGKVYNYKVLEHQETPGLGDNMAKWFKTEKNNQSVIGKSPATDKLQVSKDGGDIDAITAATISSRAFLLAIENAYKAYNACQGQTVDAATGATQQTTEAESDTIEIKCQVVQDANTDVESQNNETL